MLGKQYKTRMFHHSAFTATAYPCKTLERGVWGNSRLAEKGAEYAVGVGWKRLLPLKVK
jgi:hypothetical protein